MSDRLTKIKNTKKYIEFKCLVCEKIILQKKHGTNTCSNCLDNLLDIKYILEEKGYILLNDDNDNIKYLCSTHGEQNTTACDIRNGSFCIECSLANRKMNEKYTIDQVKYLIEIKHASLNLKLIGNEYIKISIPIDVQCLVCNRQFGYYLGNLRHNQGCWKCGRIKVGLKCRTPFDKVKEEVAKYNYTLLNIDYNTIGNALLEIECTQSHISKKTLSHIHRGDKCPDCITSRNLSESICRKYFEYLFDCKFKKTRFDWLINDEKNNLELDGYSPELNLAMEYDGPQHNEYIKFFHDNEEHFKKRQEDDRIKEKLCKEHNILIIRIPYTIKYQDMLDYIKNQCIINDIQYQDKPNITAKELNVYNITIQERNIDIDEKLKGTPWIRKNDAVSVSTTISLECNICYNIRDVLYSNLMKKNRKVPDCTYCFHEIKKQELQDIVSKSNWKVIGKYVHHRQYIDLECNKCSYQRQCKPNDTMYKKSIIGCPKCK